MTGGRVLKAEPLALGPMVLIGVNEGFYEDLARQITVARLFQRQLGFRRRHTWVSTLSHMGFSDHRGVLKATI